MKRTVSTASEARRKVDRLRALRGSPGQLHDFAMQVIAEEGSPELVKLALESLGEQVRPADGPILRALYEGLAALEADTHLHIHKENNVLFPAVLDLEAAWA